MQAQSSLKLLRTSSSGASAISKTARVTIIQLYILSDARHDTCAHIKSDCLFGITGIRPGVLTNDQYCIAPPRS